MSTTGYLTISSMDTDTLYYKNTTDIENFGYNNIDKHDEELQQPINNIYWPPSEPDTAFEGDIIFPEPTDAVFEYPANEIDNASKFDPPTTPSAQASDGLADNGQKSTTSPGAPPPLKELDRDVQDCTFSEHLSMQKAQYYHNKFVATHKMFPWLHPMTLAQLLQIYLRMFPPAAEMHHFQEKLQHSSRLADIGPLPAYNTNTHMVFAMNLKPLIKEALAGPNQIHWQEAIKAEMDRLESMHIWEAVDKLEGVTLVDSKLVLQVKTDVNNIPYKFKARFCACAQFDWENSSIDVTQAYLNADLHHNIYLKPPEGAEVPAGKVYKLVKSLYGLKQSGREWHKELDVHLQRLGFFPLLNVPSMYLRGAGETQAIIVVYIDNMLIILLHRSQIDQVKKAIIDKWKITNNGLAKEFLKIKITRDQRKRVIDMDQHAYIKEIVKEWIKPHEKMWTPMTDTPPTTSPDFEANQVLKAKYPVLVGKLLWISNTIQPDISFAINTLAHHMSKPTKDAMQAALRVVKYLNQTQGEVLRLGGGKGDEPVIVAYTDSNLASDLSAVMHLKPEIDCKGQLNSTLAKATVKAFYYLSH
ncbi:hypothetical protein NDA13_001645 [Ustilago tritici]|nr:hypothetical protein NDA13_001645 [Ustilago tritici]